MTIISFTGHRPPKLGGYNLPNPTYNFICQKLEAALKELKPVKAISGMALGIDQWSAHLCIKCNIPFIAAIPFINQECKWPKKSQETYKRILDKAAEVIIVSEGEYSAQKMQIRNEWMVDNSDKVIAVWDGSPGGTGNCIQYATKVGKEIYRINPLDLTKIEE